MFTAFALPASAIESFFCPSNYDKDYFIDTTGKVVLRPDYECSGPFVNGLAPVSDGQNCGYINKSGALAIPLRFDYAGEFSEGLAAVRIAGKFGYIDTGGKIVIAPSFVDAGPFSQGLAAVRTGKSWDYIDKSGKTVISTSYDRASEFKEGLAAVGRQDRFGYINNKGKLVIPMRFCGLSQFAEGVAGVQERGPHGEITAGYIDKNGKYVIKPQFAVAGPFSQGLADVSKDKAHDYIDHSGKVVIHTDYAWARPFADGLAAVTFKFEGGPGGYINKEGKIQIPVEQDGRHDSFSEGLALIHVPLPGCKLFQDAEYSTWQSKDYKKAIEQLEQGIKMSPVPRAYMNKAKVHQLMSQPDKALADCAEGLELFPDNKSLKEMQAELKKKVSTK
ncbi:MAG: WG repeat-containing protein [Cyanobacteria bacterium SZAS TMP-1]|nr:WG repeat-containing protein [Cyanobacteria bacterium SZAS TMP-1]